MWCDDPEEPECEGYSCPKWGRCQFSKDSMREDSSVREEWKKFQKERKEITSWLNSIRPSFK